MLFFLTLLVYTVPHIMVFGAVNTNFTVHEKHTVNEVLATFCASPGNKKWTINEVFISFVYYQ